MFLSKCKLHELTRAVKFFKTLNLAKLTYYEILETTKSASVDEIKKSYYKKGNITLIFMYTYFHSETLSS